MLLYIYNMNCKLHGVHVEVHKYSLWNITLKVIFHIKWSIEVKRESRELSLTSAALARLTLAGSERLINVNLARLSDTLTKDTYSASSTACSFATLFPNLWRSCTFSTLRPTLSLFFTCIFHLDVFYPRLLLLALSLPLSSSTVSVSVSDASRITSPALHFLQVMVKMAACTTAALHINITSLRDKQKYAYETL